MRLASLLLLVLFFPASCAWQPPHGASQQVSAGPSVTVQQGDSLYTIARDSGARVADIVALNNLRDPSMIRPGQTLVLPSGSVARAGGAAEAPSLTTVEHAEILETVEAEELPEVAPSSKPQAIPLTPSSLSQTPASQAPLTQEAMAAASATPSPKKQRWFESPGDIPAEYFAEPEGVAGEGPITLPLENRPADDAHTLAPVDDEPESLDVPKVEEKEDVAPLSLRQNSGAADAPAFAWPVVGAVVAGYGPSASGLKNDGINIAAAAGTNVKAAAGGTVVYAGSEMKGFGNMVLIRHEGSWVTAYAHLQRMLVTKDALVGKGDVIGTVGTTGSVEGAQLHFQIRKKGKPVDPQAFLPAMP